MSEGRVDFRDLVKQIAREYHTRIEMHQVGARDEARLVADYEICGRECCCKNFLKKLRQVNMKMAKLQKATLDPSKVSGRCGRLRCCLRYEHEGYEELNKKLPRVGARVRTDRGIGTVKDRQILTQLLMIDYDDDSSAMETVGIEAILERNLPKRPAPDAKKPDGGSTAEQPERANSRQRRGRQRPSRDNKQETPLKNAPTGEQGLKSVQEASEAPTEKTGESEHPESTASQRRNSKRRRRRRRRGQRLENKDSKTENESAHDDPKNEVEPGQDPSAS